MKILKLPPTKRAISTASFTLLIVIVVAVCAQVTNVQSTFADSDGYPWNPGAVATGAYDMFGYSTCPSNDTGCMHQTSNGYGISDPRLYWLRQCTSYVAWKVNQVFNVTVPTNLGDASTWASMAGSDNFGTVYPSSGYTPQVGDIAVYTSSDHVAYIYAVNNGIASLDEYNVGYDGNFYTNRTTASGSAGTPDHYIHIGTVPGGPWGGVGSATYSGGNSMASGTTLLPNYYLTSSNDQSALMLQNSDKNLVLYTGGGYSWTNFTGGQNANRLVMQSDGNLVMYTASSAVVWQSFTGGNLGAYAKLQDDGNFVVYSSSNAPLWWTGTGGNPNLAYFGSDRLTSALGAQSITQGQYIRSSDGRYAVLMQTNGDIELYGPGYHFLWDTNTAGHGDTFTQQIDGNLVLYALGVWQWQSGKSGNSNYSVIQTDGNFVQYNSSNGWIWQSGTSGQI